MLKLIFALIAVAVAVPAGGLLAGVDRRLTARLQSRQGPPLLQPFYDVLKLFGKAPCVTNPWLIFSSYVCLMASAIALLMFFMQGDMLLLFFVMTVGAVFKVAGALSANEVDSLACGARVITLEQAIRFLGDYLNGDTYFKTAYPEHNLVRARTQFRLLAEMDAHWDEMLACVRELAQKGK